MLINQAQCNTENAKTQEEILTIENQYWANMAIALERLRQNEDFKTVILEGYFKDKAINGVSLLATDYVRKNGLRGQIMEDMVAISALQDYFITIENLGTQPIDEDDIDEVE